MKANGRRLGSGVALLLLAGISAGCSSQMSRFNNVDDIFTGSTANQRSIINREPQPYPGDVSAAPVAPLDATTTGSVARSSLSPATSQHAAAPASPRAAAPSVPFGRSDEDSLAATAPRAEPARPAPAVAAAPSLPDGWSTERGIRVAVKEGDTVSSLSRRYGVPASVIAQANGLQSSDQLRSGQGVVIPAKRGAGAVAAAPVEAAAAPAMPSGGVPVPSRAPQEQVATLAPPPKAKEPAPADAPKVARGAYTVQSGDTLSKISRNTGVSVEALKQANGLQDGNLRAGQTLKVPDGSSTVAAAAPVDPAKTASIAKPAAPAPKAEQPAPTQAVAKEDKAAIEQAALSPEQAPGSTGIGKMRWPVQGKVISGFGKGSGKSNDGIDIAVPAGTPVKAAENGVVIYAGDGLKEFGNTVLVKHDNGLVTVYGNASELKVKRGQQVKRGQELALSGMTGNAKSPQVHFEVRKNSAPVNPATFLE